MHAPSALSRSDDPPSDSRSRSSRSEDSRPIGSRSGVSRPIGSRSGGSPSDDSRSAPSRSARRLGLALAGVALAATALGSAPLALGDDGAELPPDVAATIDGEPIAMREYEAWLRLSNGRKPLDELVRRRLLDRESARTGISIDLEQLERDVAAFWEDYVQGRHRGEEAKALAEIAREGFDKDGFLRIRRDAERYQRLADALCRASREVNDDSIRARFEELYGPGGNRALVRHILFSRGRLTSELRSKGAPLHETTPEAVDQKLHEKAQDALAELRAGADFAELAGRVSHDLTARTYGGAIPDYDYRRYGPELAAAVRAAEVGVPFGPVQTVAGLHVAEVTARVHTELADVRDLVLERLRTDPASGEELAALDQRLREAATIVTY